ncbi:hypothetical protein L2E82_31799 [Cichorium intybus]|uniref:Uncharacterized protein n=1 Tax=Cichorium intybus TaxID=13427 RepID=A0ACB9BIT6_CICIN|nr:hypothetical protein L2E82_31799 [Cichorium intybus]
MMKFRNSALTGRLEPCLLLQDKTDSKRMYSWWWNSHISPNKSKWLQENLTEMYYKRRPELMKLVEEMYRAYHALAERYVHATGDLYQAHKTMTKSFPNQVTGCDGEKFWISES